MTIATGRAGVEACGSIAQVCRVVLLTSNPREKALATRAAARAWRTGRLAHRFDVPLPQRPIRGKRPPLLPPGRMRKRGRAGSERSRIALLHAFAHIEHVAIDLAIDCAARFGNGQPRAFVDDWISVAQDEAMHFALLDRRLRMLGTGYGDLPAHDGLWEMAEKTAGALLSRLALVPMALEARGLDVTPATVARFEEAGDNRSAAILSRIYADEIRHVAIGTKWFESLCFAKGFTPQDHWRHLIGCHASGIVKPPFNDSARRAAGLTLDYYGTLAVSSQDGHTTAVGSGRGIQRPA